MRVGAFVMEKSVFESKRPVEAQIARVAARKIAVLENSGVVLHQAVADRGPGEEIDGYGVLGA